MNRTIYICLLWGIPFISANAQSTINGSIQEVSGKPISSATIVLQKEGDSSAVKFSISDKEGKYSLIDIREGHYVITATAVGFEKGASGTIAVFGKQTIEVPTIRLTVSKATLSAVTVQATRPFLEMRLDRMVINVEASPTNAGANVLEVLAKSPSISVDIEDNISLNGRQGVLVLLDGKRTFMSPKDLAALLKSMPSSSIDQIEIMTNPPAKYDADGMAGIINIKTKKSKNDGWNGSITTGFRTTVFTMDAITYLFPNSQNNLTFNYKKGKANFFGSLGANTFRSRNHSVFYKTYSTSSGTINGYNDFTVRGRWKGNYMPLNLGIDYTVNKKNILGITASTVVQASGDHLGKRTSDVWDGNRQLSASYIAENISTNNFNRTTGNINWKHSVDTLGQEFTLDADYVRFRFPSESSLRTVFVTNPSSVPPLFLNNNSLPTTDITAFKGDYLKPIKGGRIEGGLKSSFIRTNLRNEFFRPQNAKWESDPSLSDRFRYRENVSAVYVNMNKQLKKWSLQGGLRLERMEATGWQVRNNYQLKRTNTALFPTMFTSYEINKSNTVKFSYSRRVNRPQFYSLMPYLTVQDSLDIFRGNPDLRPEFSNRFELSYALKSKYFVTLSYSITHDVIRYISQQIGTERATLYSPMNIDKFKSLTLTLSTPVKPTSWWDINIFTSFYNNQYHNLQNWSSTRFFFSLSQNITNTFKLGKTWKGEMNFNYNTRQVDQITEREPIIYNFSTGLTKQVLSEKGNVTLNITDPFAWYQYRFRAYYIRLYETGTFRYPSRSVGLTFNYRFGKVNNQGRQRTTASQEEQNR